MSGPVSLEDVAGVGARETETGPVELMESREAEVGALRVRRALPRRGAANGGVVVLRGPHGPRGGERGEGPGRGAASPHRGLVAGEVLHRDSLGSEQVIRPGQLNLMTAGRGVAHSEERTGRHAGELHVGVDLELHGHPTVVPLQPDFEYALVVLTGAVEVDGTVVVPGRLAYLGIGRDECRLGASEPARCLMFGGPPFPERVVMWWNFVARTRDEITVAHEEWALGGERFGRVASALPRVEVGSPPWVSPGHQAP